MQAKLSSTNDYRPRMVGLLKKLKKTMGDAKRPFIMIYSNPDPDALASAQALSLIMEEEGLDPVIGCTGSVGRLENETMINLLSIPVKTLTTDDLREADLIAVVDSQPEFFRGFDLPRVDIVIDHHPKKSKRSRPFVHIQSRCLAVSSLLTAYLVAGDYPISKKLATALYYGIQTDSRNFLKSPTDIDSDAIHVLEGKIDRATLRKIQFSSYSLHRLNYFSVALSKLRYANYILYSDLGSVPSSDICVQVADFLIRVKEARWAIVSGVVDDKLVIIFRCDGHKKNAGKLAETAFGEYGSAGGHRTMARAEIPGDKLPDGMALTQNEKIEKFVLGAITEVERSFNPITRRAKRDMTE